MISDWEPQITRMETDFSQNYWFFGHFVDVSFSMPSPVFVDVSFSMPSPVGADVSFSMPSPVGADLCVRPENRN